MIEKTVIFFILIKYSNCYLNNPVNFLSTLVYIFNSVCMPRVAHLQTLHEVYLYTNMERTIKQISSKLKNKFVLTVNCLLRIVTSKLELVYMQTVSYNHIGRFTRKLFGYQNIITSKLDFAISIRVFMLQQEFRKWNTCRPTLPYSVFTEIITD